MNNNYKILIDKLEKEFSDIETSLVKELRTLINLPTNDMELDIKDDLYSVAYKLVTYKEIIYAIKDNEILSSESIEYLKDIKYPLDFLYSKWLKADYHLHNPIGEILNFSIEYEINDEELEDELC